MTGASRQELIDLLEPAVEAMGYELVDLECSVGRGKGVIRLFIDREDGIGLGDCELVSRQVSSVLDVEDPVPGDYNLEVSSPGLDRKLVKPEHFDQFAGSLVKVKLKKLVQGRRRLQGQLVGREGDRIVVNSGSDTYSLPMVDIDTARLIPEL